MPEVIEVIEVLQGTEDSLKRELEEWEKKEEAEERANLLRKFSGGVKKYLLYPGMVTSRFGGDEHYIDAPTLARFYGVDLKECVEIEYGSAYFDPGFNRHCIGLLVLRPRFDGNYSLSICGRWPNENSNCR